MSTFYKKLQGTNAFGKGMNPFFSLPLINKIEGKSGLFY